MPNTYTQLYIHIVFSVKGRQILNTKPSYMAILWALLKTKNKQFQINSMPDHVHILVGITPDTAISDLVRDIKAHSSKWWVVGRFEWQEGFGAFSYAQSQLGDVVNYGKASYPENMRGIP